MIVHHRILSSVVLGASLALALLLALAAGAPVQADGGTGTLWLPLSLDRPHDPVVVPGEALPGLSGVPLDEVFVYAYRTVSTPVQIPAQIDERTAGGVYVPLEDGRLDANDELVFMAADVGGWVLSPTLKFGETSLAPAAVVTLTDPLGARAGCTSIARPRLPRPSRAMSLMMRRRTASRGKDTMRSVSIRGAFFGII